MSPKLRRRAYLVELGKLQEILFDIEDKHFDEVPSNVELKIEDCAEKLLKLVGRE